MLQNFCPFKFLVSVLPRFSIQYSFYSLCPPNDISSPVCNGETYESMGAAPSHTFSAKAPRNHYSSALPASTFKVMEPKYKRLSEPHSAIQFSCARNMKAPSPPSAFPALCLIELQHMKPSCFHGSKAERSPPAFLRGAGAGLRPGRACL